MDQLSPSLAFLLNLAKIESIVTRRFDAGLGGLGFTEFMILHHLSIAEEEKLRRIDLADKVGLTASGITRLLAPMEKVGLINREAHAGDARVSYVTLAPGGARKLEEAVEKAELLTTELIPTATSKQLKEFTGLLRVPLL